MSPAGTVEPEAWPLREVASWGRVRRVAHPCSRPSFPDQIARPADGNTVLPIGMLRSYGDTPLNSGGAVVDMTRLDRFIRLDAEAGTLRAEAGMSIDALLPVLVPRGWFLPTTPGSRFVTLGGAVANDVHGKNHESAGSIGCSVAELVLLRTDGSRKTVRPSDPAFRATVGGLGLTGIITEVEMALAPIRSAFLDVERLPLENVSDFFAISEASGDWEHTVAWIDCTARGTARGRGVFSRGRWRDDGRLVPHSTASGPTLPLDLPRGSLNRVTLAAFNALYRRLQLRGPAKGVEHYSAFFYPLDGIRHWNRLYGRKGFYQYQCVLPPDTARDSVDELLRIISEFGEGSFLAVLKKLGARQSGGLISFPREGTTLALDFANRGERTLALFSRLDEIVRSAGGRLYAAKDGRMTAEMFRAGYPRWEELKELKDPGISSDFWRRVAKA